MTEGDEASVSPKMAPKDSSNSPSRAAAKQDEETSPFKKEVHRVDANGDRTKIVPRKTTTLSEPRHETKEVQNSKKRAVSGSDEKKKKQRFEKCVSRNKTADKSPEGGDVGIRTLEQQKYHLKETVWQNLEDKSIREMAVSI